MKKNIIIAVLSLVVVILAGIICDQNTRINTYDRYNKNCETLLDSIASWDDSFIDTIVETDTYYNYLESREYLDSIIWRK